MSAELPAAAPYRKYVIIYRYEVNGVLWHTETADATSLDTSSWTRLTLVYIDFPGIPPIHIYGSNVVVPINALHCVVIL